MVPVLSSDDDVEPARAFKHLGVANEDAALRRESAADHDGRRRSEAQCTGAGDDEHGDGVDHRIGPRAAEQTPRQEDARRYQDDDGDEDGCDLVHELLDGRLRALRLLHHARHLAQHRLVAHGRRLDVDDAALVDRPTDNGVADASLNGNRLAGDHGLVNGRLAGPDDAVDCDALAGAGDEDVSAPNLFDRRRRLDPVDEEHGRAGGQAQQRPKRRRGSGLCALLEVLAEGDEDEHGGAHVKEHVAAVVREHRPGTEAEGDARAECHEDVHVWVQVAQARVRAPIEAPAEHDLHGRRQREQDPSRELGVAVDGQIGDVHGHREDDRGHGENGAEDEGVQRPARERFALLVAAVIG